MTNAKTGDYWSTLSDDEHRRINQAFDKIAAATLAMPEYDVIMGYVRKLQDVEHQQAERYRALEDVAGELASALEILRGEQNGPPLIRSEARWWAAMDVGKIALDRYAALKTEA